MKRQPRKLTLYIRAEKPCYGSEFEITVSSYMSESDRYSTVIPLETVEVEVNVPVLDIKTLTLKEIEQLQELIQKEKNESHMRVNAIKEKIQNLQCLEVKSD